MIKKEIYPKTKRLSCKGDCVHITEKMDGSNMVIFKKDNLIYVAQRKTIISEEEFESNKDIMYKGLYCWLQANIDYLKEHLIEGSCICGEWLGMGKLKYDVGEFDRHYYMFAKANIDEEFNLYNIIYNHDLFIYPFDNKEIPYFIGVVPVVADLNILPNKEYLDSLYIKYTDKVKRNVEGFVVDYNNIITKYVRMKNGKLAEHFDREN